LNWIFLQPLQKTDRKAFKLLGLLLQKSVTWRREYVFTLFAGSKRGVTVGPA
jgi:hypothetical protein